MIENLGTKEANREDVREVSDVVGANQDLREIEKEASQGAQLLRFSQTSIGEIAETLRDIYEKKGTGRIDDATLKNLQSLGLVEVLEDLNLGKFLKWVLNSTERLIDRSSFSHSEDVRDLYDVATRADIRAEISEANERSAELEAKRALTKDELTFSERLHSIAKQVGDVTAFSGALVGIGGFLTGHFAGLALGGALYLGSKIAQWYIGEDRQLKSCSHDWSREKKYAIEDRLVFLRTLESVANDLETNYLALDDRNFVRLSPEGRSFLEVASRPENAGLTLENFLQHKSSFETPEGIEKLLNLLDIASRPFGREVTELSIADRFVLLTHGLVDKVRLAPAYSNSGAENKLHPEHVLMEAIRAKLAQHFIEHREDYPEVHDKSKRIELPPRDMTLTGERVIEKRARAIETFCKLKPEDPAAKIIGGASETPAPLALKISPKGEEVLSALKNARKSGARTRPLFSAMDLIAANGKEFGSVAVA